MDSLTGIPVSPGVAIGPAFVIDAQGVRIPRRTIRPDEVDHEIERFRKAVESAREEIESLQHEVTGVLGKDYGAIFSVHSRVLKDKRLLSEIEKEIRERRLTPEYASALVLRKYARILSNVDDPYLAQRVNDINDIRDRLLKQLLGLRHEEIHELSEPAIIIAQDLTPTQTVSLDRSKVLGFAVDAGGRASHTAILARALEIPAVVGLETVSALASTGDMIIVDGHRGRVVISPDEETLEHYRAEQKKYFLFETELLELRDQPAVTRDGIKVSLLANIEFPHEVKTAIEHGAEGVGLYRTEFLFLESKTRPSEETHFRAYEEVVRELENRPVTIRTVDLGADKLIADHHERNPFLGCRSLRYCLAHPEIFRDQLRAIFRVSALGNVRMMFPLVSTLEELEQAMEIVNEVKEELRSEKIPFNENMPIGIMIEVPAAALMADVFAKHADFFSIGTNDLIQYTLAVDRGNERVSGLYSAAHPSVLRLIKNTIDAADAAGIEVAMCGEMCSDVLYLPLLLGMGLRVMSATPAAIPEMKKAVRSLTIPQTQEIAARALSLAADRDVREYLAEKQKELLPDFASP